MYISEIIFKVDMLNESLEHEKTACRGNQIAIIKAKKPLSSGKLYNI